MKSLLLVEVSLCLFLVGCCANDYREPAYPHKHNVGWRDSPLKGIQTYGKFILRKGEATDNGRIQVKVLDILSDNSCAHPTRDNSARAVLQFVRMADKEVLCVAAKTEHTSSILASACGNELIVFGIASCTVKTINLKEGWVLFELMG